MQKADSEWRHHALIEVKHFGVESEVDVKKMPAETYWNKVLSMKDHYGKFIYENLEVVISIYSQFLLQTHRWKDYSVRSKI